METKHTIRGTAMKVSTKGRYALRLLVDLARHEQDGVIALKDIAARQEVSKKYLEQIVRNLTKAGILRTTRGFLGGYQLARAPADITLGEVLFATETEMSVVDCLKPGQECGRHDTCATFAVWKGLNDVIANYLNSISLQTILDNSKEGWGGGCMIDKTQ